MELSNLYIHFAFAAIAVLGLFFFFGLLAQLNFFRKKSNSDDLAGKPAGLNSNYSPISTENVIECSVYEYNVPDVTLEQTGDYFNRETLPTDQSFEKKIRSHKKRYTIVTVL